MKRLLDPNSNDDLAQILVHDSIVELRKVKSKNPTGPSHKKGKITKIKVGEIVEIKGEVSGTTTRLEKITINKNIEEILLHTKNSIYKLIPDPNKLPRLISLRYLQKGYLDFEEKMPDGFYDGGRHTKFQLDHKNNMKPITGAREMVVLNSNTDQPLKSKLEAAQKLLQNVPDLEKRITLLAMFVSNTLGGIQQQDYLNQDIVKLSEQEITKIIDLYKTDYLPIGYLQHGVCRHRALLFKYLADRLNIPCRLVRGDYQTSTGGGGHAWNVVKINNQFFVVDVMHNPLELYPENSPKAQKYTRKNLQGIPGGFGGRSIKRV